MPELPLFDKWNAVKKKLQDETRVRYFRERQVWWCSIGQNLGSESYGKGETFTRPVLVFKKLSGEIFFGVTAHKQGKGRKLVRNYPA